VRLGCKRLDWEELEPQAQLAKPRFMHDPGREPAVYRLLLPQAPAGPPEFFGAVLDEDRHWLFIEWVEGRELHQVGERGLWEAAASWLGRLHVELASEVERAASIRLFDRDAAFYRRWIERAREFARAPGRPQGHAALVEWLAERHEAVVEALLALPRTVVHGEFYASNVLIANDAAQPRVAPVDWELASVGPGVGDLAALVSGGWGEEDRMAIAAAYGEVPGASLAGLDFARLQVAIQWLGWAPPEWEPPEGQRHDWAAEAAALAEGLGL